MTPLSKMPLLPAVMCLSSLFFFFQAEDGIRDKLVTGVQTCALPISTSGGGGTSRLGGAPADIFGLVHVCTARRLAGDPRSEERRVGKEWRSRGSPYH